MITEIVVETNGMTDRQRAVFFAAGQATAESFTQVMWGDDKSTWTLRQSFVGKVMGTIVLHPNGPQQYLWGTHEEAMAAAIAFRDMCKEIAGKEDAQ